MFSKLFILIVLLIIKSVININSNDLCYISEEVVFCRGKFGYKCGTNVCTQSEEICEKYEQIKDILSRTFLPNIFVQKYDEFETHIKQCDIKQQLKQEENVCYNRDDCMFKKTLPLRGNFMRVFEKKVCDCVGRLNYKCGVTYCATNKLVCDDFLKKQINSVNLSLCESK